MCFSSTASFSAGIVLTGIGIACLKKTNHRSQLLFASIPFIFGIQQFAERILWLTLPKSDYYVLQKIATYMYLFFAHVLWPLLVPIAILFVEKTNTRKTIQKIFIGAGIIVCLYLAYCLITFNVKSTIEEYHINYILDYPEVFSNYWIFLYAMATIAPPFFSHIKRMWILGLTILISYLITQIFYQNYILSVWCFFSSIISLLIYFFVIKIAKNPKNFTI